MTRQLTLVKLAVHEQIQGKQRYRNVEKEHISAGVADGVLTITLPKQTAEDKAKATRQIEIK